ncbi:MAG: hypothetical protein FWH16_04540, partial [Oscillospiraceae bacterium]|nr:hypothetical protein [Oscillospiraceae bacterium]
MKRRIIALLLTLLMCAALLAPVASAEGDYAWRAFEIGDYISRYSLAYKNSGSDPLFDALMEVLEDDPE